jgi:undecaprenyl-diphosphatase
MTRALVITNPAAARTAKGSVRDLLDTLKRAGWSVEDLATGGSGDARRMAEAAVREHLDVVVVFGGDGTTMQAASALVGTPVHLGIIPGGTGNLLAGNLRIPASPAAATRTLLGARVRCIDLGRMDRDDGVHYFAVACGAGYDARVMGETQRVQKRRWGMGAYVATTLRLLSQLKNLPFRIRVDGESFEAVGCMALVANCPEVIPPYVRLRRSISPEDGLLDALVVRADSLASSVHAAWDILREGRAAGGEDRLWYRQGREITIECDTTQPVQLDGELGGESPFTVSVVPGALNILAPIAS